MKSRISVGETVEWNGSSERALPDNGCRHRTPVIRPTVFPFKGALWGASGSHTLIKRRHLIDTLCKVLWTKRTGLFYSPADLVDHHLPAGCTQVRAFMRTCVYFVWLSVRSSFYISWLLSLFQQPSPFCSDHFSQQINNSIKPVGQMGKVVEINSRIRSLGVCESQDGEGDTIKCVYASLDTHPFPCHSNCLLYQEVLGNYREAACSNGVLPQPIIWRDSSCQGTIEQGMELSYDVEKDLPQ